MSSSTSTSTPLSNFDPFAVHPFTNYTSSNPNGNNYDRSNASYAYPCRLEHYPTHAPQPTTPISSHQQSSPKSYVYTPPRPSRTTGIFVPFRQETSSPDLSDVLKSKSEQLITKNPSKAWRGGSFHTRCTDQVHRNVNRGPENVEASRLDVVEMGYAETDCKFFLNHCLTIFFRFSLASSTVCTSIPVYSGYSSESMTPWPYSGFSLSLKFDVFPRSVWSSSWRVTFFHRWNRFSPFDMLFKVREFIRRNWKQRWEHGWIYGPFWEISILVMNWSFEIFCLIDGKLSGGGIEGQWDIQEVSEISL